ncbi:hypothetical protein [Thiobaca trueperi]|uniref:hypothetical protein n=1 Tax=Thiobaca trueperi TaxID=127458 RepID=UPI001404C7DE|nr:hypothetical protein [Thiobaca trueperi]
MAILQVRFDRFDVSTEIPILLSFFGMGQLVEVGLSAEFQVAFDLFTADAAGIHRPENGATRLADGCSRSQTHL